MQWCLAHPVLTFILILFAMYVISNIFYNHYKTKNNEITKDILKLQVEYEKNKDEDNK